MSAVRHEVVLANGIRHHVALTGERGRPLVLCLHGFPECWYSWRHQLDALSDRFLVAAPDLRGYGQTDKPARVRDYRIDALARDASALVGALGYGQANVVGHDWGGAVAWYLASAEPERVTKLAILNSPHPRLLLDRFARLDRRQVPKSLYMLAFQLPWLPERLFAPARLARVMRSTASRREAFTAEDVSTFERVLSEPGTVTGGLNYYRAVFRDLLWPPRRRVLLDTLDRGVPSPTLVLWGERDRFLDTSLLDGLDRHVTGPLQVHRIAQAGHWVQQEAPAEVNDALRTFFG